MQPLQPQRPRGASAGRRRPGSGAADRRHLANLVDRLEPASNGGGGSRAAGGEASSSRAVGQPAPPPPTAQPAAPRPATSPAHVTSPGASNAQLSTRPEIGTLADEWINLARPPRKDERPYAVQPQQEWRLGVKHPGEYTLLERRRQARRERQLKEEAERVAAEAAKTRRMISGRPRRLEPAALTGRAAETSQAPASPSPPQPQLALQPAPPRIADAEASRPPIPQRRESGAGGAPLLPPAPAPHHHDNPLLLHSTLSSIGSRSYSPARTPQSLLATRRPNHELSGDRRGSTGHSISLLDTGVALLPSPGTGRAQQTPHNESADAHPELPEPAVKAVVTPSATASGPRRLRRFEQAPVPHALHEVLEGKRTLLSLHSTADDGLVMGPGGRRPNRYEDLVPSPAIGPSAAKTLAQCVRYEELARGRIAAVHLAGLQRLERGLEAELRRNVDDDVAFVLSLEITHRRSLEREQQHAWELVRDSATEEHADVAAADERRALFAEARASLHDIAGRQYEDFVELVRCQRRFVDSREETREDLLRRHAALLAEEALMREAVGLIKERERWISGFSDATWYAEAYAMHYAAMLDDFAEEAHARYHRRAAALHREAPERVARYAIVQEEAEEREALLRPLEEVAAHEAALRRHFHSLSATSVLEWDAFLARVQLSGPEEDAARAAVIFEEQREARDTLFVTQLEPMERAAIAAEEDAQRERLAALHYTATFSCRADRLFAVEIAERSELQRARVRELQRALKPVYVEAGLIAWEAEESQRRAALEETMQRESAAQQHFGLCECEHAGSHESLIGEEAAERATLFKAFRSQRMEIIHNETDDGLEKKVLWHVAEIEADDRRIYKMQEAVARAELEPAWACLSGYLHARAAVEAEIRCCGGSTRLQFEEGAARAGIEADQRTVFERLIAPVARAAHQENAVAIVVHELMPVSLAVAWLDLMPADAGTDWIPGLSGPV